MPLVREPVFTRKSEQRKQLIAERVTTLVESFPQFKYAAIAATLANWTASAVKKACFMIGTDLIDSDRTNRVSLPKTLTDVFLDPEFSNDRIIELREMVLAIKSSVTEPIYLDDSEDMEES